MCFCTSTRLGELEFSLDQFEIVLRVVPMHEFGEIFFEWWICVFVFVYVVELV